MKPTDDERCDLLEELFPANARLQVGSDDVLQWVRQARAAREIRRRRCGVAALLGAPLAILSVMFLFLSPPALLRDRSAATANPPPPAGTVNTGRPHTVERVDDDHLLRLLGDTPAALVQWPDGRRSLLVVVRNPTKAN